MKFSCDACGAQYMIADDKIGARGVKVRCKKCANVIILRPEASSQPPGPPTTISAPPSSAHRDQREETTNPGLRAGDAAPDAAPRKPTPVPPRPPPIDEQEDSDATLAVDDLALAAAMAPSAGDDPALPPEVTGTSSEFGLSVEFAAAGFDEPVAQVGRRTRAPTLSVGLDVARLQPPPDQVTSPFTARIATGGSLEQVAMDADARAASPATQKKNNGANGDNGAPDLAARAGLGASVPQIEELGPTVRTRVDVQSIESTGTSIPNDDTDFDHSVHGELGEPKTAVGQVATGEAGEDGARIAAEMGSAPDSEMVARAEFEAELAERQSDAAALDEATEDAVAPSSLAALAAAASEALGPPSPADGLDTEDGSHDDGLGKRQTTDRSDAFGVVVAPAEPEDDAPATPKRDSLAAARALAKEAAAALTPDEDSTDSQLERAKDPVALENAIGSAFDSVFGDGAGAGDPFDELVQGAAEALDEVEVDRASTRVFDSEAMEKVQAEQDMAGSAAAETAPRAEPRQWYVAIDDEQVGPLRSSEVQVRWDANDVDANTLCWKPGMADWIAIRFIKELEGLGSMDGDGATMVADVELPPESTSEPEAAAKVPSVIGTPAEPSTQPHRSIRETARVDTGRPALEEVPGDPDEPMEASEPSWRPSAASALASLAAEELAGSGPSAALPGGDDAISALLDDRGKTSGGRSPSSLFGAAELSSSRIMRPLPKGPEVTSSVSLRDPVADRSGNRALVPVFVLGGVAIALAALVLYLVLRPPAPEGSPAMASNAAVTPTPDPKVILPVRQPEAAPEAAPTPSEAAAVPAEPAAAALGASAPPEVAEAAPSPAPEVAEASPAKVKRRRGASKRPKARTGSGSSARREREAAAEAARERLRARARARAEATREAADAAEDEPPPEPKRRAAPKKTADQLSATDLLAVSTKPARSAAKADPALPEQLEDSDIFRVLRQHKSEIRKCRKRQKEVDPNLEGVMKVKFTIQKTGRTSSHTVSPDKFSSSVVGKCVLASVRNWRFPRFTGRPLPLDFPVRMGSR